MNRWVARKNPNLLTRSLHTLLSRHTSNSSPIDFIETASPLLILRSRFRLHVKLGSALILIISSDR